MHADRHIVGLGQVRDARRLRDPADPGRVDHHIVGGLVHQHRIVIGPAQQHLADRNRHPALAAKIGDRIQVVHLDHIFQPQWLHFAQRLGDPERRR